MIHLGNNNNAASQKEAAIQMKVPITVKAYNYEDPKFDTRHLHDN